MVTRSLPTAVYQGDVPDVTTVIEHGWNRPQRRSSSSDAATASSSPFLEAGSATQPTASVAVTTNPLWLGLA